MGRETKTFDPEKYLVIVGTHQVGGYAEDGGIEGEPNAELYTSTAGADGDKTRSRVMDKSWTFKLKLAGTSASNAYLSGIAQTGALVPFLLRDGSGSDVVAAGEAWVKKYPSIGAGKSKNDQEWEIETGAATVALLGN